VRPELLQHTSPQNASHSHNSSRNTLTVASTDAFGKAVGIEGPFLTSRAKFPCSDYSTATTGPLARNVGGGGGKRRLPCQGKANALLSILGQDQKRDQLGRFHLPPKKNGKKIRTNRDKLRRLGRGAARESRVYPPKLKGESIEEILPYGNFLSMIRYINKEFE